MMFSDGSPERSKWPTLLLLALAELLAMAVWFSASAVVPALSQAWGLSDAGRAWLTMSVQLGFVAGAFTSAVTNLADRLPSPLLFPVSALLAALSTLMIPAIAGGLVTALIFRFLTGVFLAGVYPVGMKIMATWARTDRGLAIGLLVGALTLDSASPHLLAAFGGTNDWRLVLWLAALSATLGAIIAALFVREGPYRAATEGFNRKYVGEILSRRDLLLVNLGYLGHMWELYAMWTWLPAFLLASFKISGVSQGKARLAAFAVIGAGGISCVVAGKLADRLGRTTLTIASLGVSGICAVSIGFLFGGDPLWVLLLALIWGFSVIADSAQFSAALSELCRPEYIGTALTLQTSLGLLLTLATIRIVPWIEQLAGWRWAFTLLAIGPACGILAMYRLRTLPESLRLAGGQR
jgi:MFS family permease